MINSEQGEIYLVTNMKNNKKYIGQTVSILSTGRKNGTDNRWIQHLNAAKNYSDGCRVLCNAIRKHGDESFKVETLLYCNIESLDFYEIKFIEFYDSLAPNGYNLETGGSKGKRLHQETKDKLSEQHRFLNISDENKEKVFECMKTLGIYKLPIGINFTSNSNVIAGLEGFLVKKSKTSNTYKAFTSNDKTLTEKLKLALEYFKHIEEKNEDKIKELDEIYDYDIRKTSRNNKIGDDFKNILLKMNIKLEDLPVGIRYEKRNNRFYIKFEKEGYCKYFAKYKPEKSLLDAIEYMKNLQSQRESA